MSDILQAWQDKSLTEERFWLVASAAVSVGTLVWLVGSGRDSSKDSGKSPEVPLVDSWPEIRIPVEMRSGEVYTVHEIKHWQFPNIGIKGLHFVWNEKYPVIAVGTSWEVQALRIKYLESESRPGRVGLQPVEDPFFVDMDKAVTSINTGIISLQEARNLAVEASSLISLSYNDDQTGSLVSVFPRPIDGKNYTLVFGEKLLDYKGNPSPNAFLAVKFNFEIPKDLPPMAV